MSERKWTPTETKALMDLYLSPDQLTLLQIGDAIGRSESSVSGKITRLGIANRGSQATRSRERRTGIPWEPKVYSKCKKIELPQEPEPEGIPPGLMMGNVFEDDPRAVKANLTGYMPSRSAVGIRSSMGNW